MNLQKLMNRVKLPSLMKSAKMMINDDLKTTTTTMMSPPLPMLKTTMTTINYLSSYVYIHDKAMSTYIQDKRGQSDKNFCLISVGQNRLQFNNVNTVK